MVHTTNMAGAYIAAKNAKKRQLEFDQCDEPVIDKQHENSKLSKYDKFFEKSKEICKYAKYIKIKKIIYWTLFCVGIALSIIMLPIGGVKSIESLIISGFILLVISLVVLLFPALFSLNNVICVRIYNNKLCFVYLTTFKMKVYYDDQFICQAKRGKLVNCKCNNLKIQVYASSYTYWIKFNNERPIRKRFGQYY